MNIAFNDRAIDQADLDQLLKNVRAIRRRQVKRVGQLVIFGECPRPALARKAKAVNPRLERRAVKHLRFRVVH